MGSIIDDLGVGIIPDASPSLRTRIATVPLKPEVFNSPTEQNAVNTLYNFQSAAASSACTPLNQQKVKKTVKRQIKNKAVKRNIAPSFPCRTRTGMSLAVDTAWHKRGFDSLTCNYFTILKIWKFYCQFLSFFITQSWHGREFESTYPPSIW